MMTLCQAAEAGDVQEIQRLLASGVPVDTVDNAPANWTPLMVATYQRQLDAVKILVTAGANLSFEDYDFFSAVTLAGRRKYWEILQFLAEVGADFGASGSDGVTGVDHVLRCRSRHRRKAIFDVLELRLTGCPVIPERIGSRMEDIGCPRCGQSTVTCRYHWSGFGDSWDNFHHHCSNPACGENRKREGIPGRFPKPEDDDWARCPFCGRSTKPTDAGSVAKSHE